MDPNRGDHPYNIKQNIVVNYIAQRIYYLFRITSRRIANIIRISSSMMYMMCGRDVGCVCRYTYLLYIYICLCWANIDFFPITPRTPRIISVYGRWRFIIDIGTASMQNLLKAEREHLGVQKKTWNIVRARSPQLIIRPAASVWLFGRWFSRARGVLGEFRGMEGLGAGCFGYTPAVCPARVYGFMNLSILIESWPAPRDVCEGWTDGS